MKTTQTSRYPEIRTQLNPFTTDAITETSRDDFVLLTVWRGQHAFAMWCLINDRDHSDPVSFLDFAAQ